MCIIIFKKDGIECHRDVIIKFLGIILKCHKFLILFDFIIYQKKEIFYERFNDYIKANNITPDTFWNVNKEKLSSDEFKECLEVIGFNFDKDEFGDVVFDVSDDKF